MGTGDVVATKVANALIESAVPRLQGLGGVERIRNRDGGLWVGGRVTVTSTELSFSPNAVNRAAHAGDTSFTIPLADVRGVEVEPAFLTKIIAITWTGGVQRFRCFGAAAFAGQIRSAAG